MTPDWLQEFLVSSVRRNVCTRIHCTTCGAAEFRQGLLAGSVGVGNASLGRADRETVLDIAKALAGVRPDSNLALEDAIRCILFDLWSGIPALDRQVEESLSGSWPGEVLERMKKHHAARQAARRAAEGYEAPASVMKRKEEKRRLKHEQHAKRLALKSERDVIWRRNRANEIEATNEGARLHVETGGDRDPG